MTALSNLFRVIGLGLAWLPLVVAAQDGLVAKRVVDPGPMKNPSAAYWSDAPAVAVPMNPQNITTPKLQQAAVTELKVKAAHNGHWLAFLIEWPDPTKSDRIVVDQFGDQVAVELPVKYNRAALPSPMMGHRGARVTILQWRAAFQKDLEDGEEPQVRDLYPNALVDIYPDLVLRATDARPYMGAVGLDNPISHPNRTPVLDQMAEGWGTLTVKPEQRADGKGVWSDGYWRVVISYPLAGPNRQRPAPRSGRRDRGGVRGVGRRRARGGQPQGLVQLGAA